MRVITPPSRRVGSKISKTKLGALLVVLLIAGGLWLRPSQTAAPTSPTQTSTTAVQGESATNSTGDLRTFTADEFKTLYRSIAYPNTQEITTPPFITGNVAADDHLRSIAASRGYKLTSLPVEPIVKISGNGLTSDDLLQPSAADAWQELKAAASHVGIPLTIVSAYRSIDFQRDLFLSRLHQSGVSNSEIASGQADEVIIAVLESAALPGYSRHHTGYTMDLACGNIGLYGFKTTGCYKWLSQNNYQNAKLHGWIPSYPEGTSTQGPEPEPWEFVWVGKNVLFKH